MKKIILFFIAILFGISLAGQSGGDGKAPSTAYYGTISTSTTWTYAYNSGIIYVGQSGNQDLTITTGGSLSIEAGVTVIFCTTSSDLIITGTGTITANGTSSSKITFTRNYPTISYWGHISFQSMGSAGVSVFDNCIIEYGDVRGNSSPASYGGGIYADFNNITISNCKIQYNKAQWGGGLFINQNKSPYITNCIFFDNYSKEAGGGIYCWNRSGTIIENSIFDSNHCDGTTYNYYTGGGLASQSNCSITVNNCTFVNNTSSRSTGQSLMFYASINDKAINCIFWGSGSHFYLSGTNTLNYCAAQGSAPSGTGNFVLNSSNTAPDGPNFNATDGSDWSIKFISPCRDAGTSSGAPLTDYLGNPRIYNYDIGAYEVQYSRWTGASDDSWTNSSNWEENIDPSTGTGDVIIPAGLFNYPDEGTVTIGTGNYLIIDPDAQAIFGTLNNSGTLWLKSDSYGVADSIASLIVGQYNQDGGNEKIELYLTGGGTITTYKWHYISSPVSSLAVSTFAPAHTLDLAAWYDNRVTGSLATGWVAYDGYVYSTGVSDGPPFSTLSPGTGYDYYSGIDQKYTFSGLLNTSDVTVDLSYSSDDNLHGFNLLGNPFSSGLNWDDVANETYYAYPANTSKSLYFTRDNVQCSYINGVGIPSDVTGVIPPMQGFFNKTYSAGNTITFSSDARIQTDIHPRYKKLSVIPLVRLSLAEGKSSDETVVRFDNSAETGLDNNFDALKLFLSSDNVSIYSSSSGVNYSINGQPFPDTIVQIPVVINLTKDTLHTITATQLQGLDKYDVTLTDNTTGFIADLKTTPVLTFSDGPGTITGRFILTVGTASIVTGVETPLASNNTFNIYAANSFINVQTISDEWDGKSGTVEVIDLTGNTVKELQNAEFSRNSLVQVPVAGFKGLYIVEIRSGIMRYVGKVVIR